MVHMQPDGSITTAATDDPRLNRRASLMTADTNETSLLGRTPNHPLPSLEWPGDEPPAYWWGVNSAGELTKVFRSYEDYCNG